MTVALQQISYLLTPALLTATVPFDFRRRAVIAIIILLVNTAYDS